MMANSDTLAAIKALIEEHTSSLNQMLQQYTSAIDARFEAFTSQIHGSSHRSPSIQPSVNYFTPPIDSYARAVENTRPQFAELESRCRRLSTITEMKPDLAITVNHQVMSLGSEPIPQIAPSSNSDLADLNMTAAELVGKDEEASDLVGEVEDLVSDEVVAMKLPDTDEKELALLGDDPISGEGIVLDLPPVFLTGTVESKACHLLSDNFGKNGHILNLWIDKPIGKTTVSDRRNRKAGISTSSASAKNTNRLKDSTFVKDRGKTRASVRSWSRRVAQPRKSWRGEARLNRGQPCLDIRCCKRFGCRTALKHDGGNRRRDRGGCKEAWSRRIAMWRKQGKLKPAAIRGETRLRARRGKAKVKMMRIDMAVFGWIMTTSAEKWAALWRSDLRWKLRWQTTAPAPKREPSEEDGIVQQRCNWARPMC